jgi:hypothetical protein
MYLNNIDDLVNSILDNFFEYIIKDNILDKIKKDNNFVKFQNDIMQFIKNYTDTLSKKDILDVIKNDNYYLNLIQIINRYCAFYIYLGIAYNYEGDRNLYITNLIESSKYQKDSLFQLTNFFNSDNNSKLVKFYNDIKNIIILYEYGTMDKIKIILANNITKYDSLIKLFNELGEDYIINYFFIKNNFHNIIKSLIFKQIYLKEDRNDLLKIISDDANLDVEYKYIDIIVSNEKKIVDFNFIEKFITINKMNPKLAEEYYNYLVEMKNINDLIIKENDDFINYLFNNKILIPITEDFLRYHKDTEKYDTDSFIKNENINARDATKIKFIINKTNNIINLNSELVEKNANLKLDVLNSFYKPFDPRMVVLYNDNEEIKIIQKINNSENAMDKNLLIELENIRKYPYINFKSIKDNGFKIRPNKTIIGVRSINFKYSNKYSKLPIETRIGHGNIDMNIIGIIWNQTKNPLYNFNLKDFYNVKNKQDSNGYTSFVKVMKNTFNTNKKNKLYYWLFDNNYDKIKIDTYIDYNSKNNENNFKIMVGEIYNIYINLLEEKINMLFNNIKSFNITKFNNILNYYNKEYFNFDLNPDIKNTIINNAMKNLKNVEMSLDDYDDFLLKKKSDVIELPSIIKSKEKKNIFILNKINNLQIESVIDINDNAICNHYIKWKNIMSLSKKSDEFTQAVFNYVKQYVKINNLGDYICKSCGEDVQIKKYVHQGTYVEELDTFLTTSLAVNQNLEEISKYSKYMRTIKNIEKNIEKLSNVINISSYIGNTSVIKLRRRMLIKDIIDLILLHTDWLKSQNKDRIEIYSKKYGINKDLTNLFFFELKDDIFLTSSTDTDQYKIIKYNNIIVYTIFIYILEINSGQIINLKTDKQYNYYLFNIIKDKLFENLYLRINQKEKLPFSKLPLFSYLIYYISGQIISNRIWLYNTTNLNNKDKLVFITNLQKIAIHTFIDLINTIVEANFSDEKNYIYEILNMRFTNKLNYLFNDLQILKNLEIKLNSNILINNDNKILLKTIKHNYINLDLDTIDILENKYSELYNIRNQYKAKTFELRKKQIEFDNTIFNKLTNCDSGEFHNWVFRINDLYCSDCNKSFNELLNDKDNKSSIFYLKKIKLLNLKKISKKYCISGNLHEFENKICSICHIDINKFKPSDEELNQLDKNLDKKINNEAFIHINEMINYNKKIINKNKKIDKIINKFLKKYNKKVNNNINKYIDTFIDRLVNLLGLKIKILDQIFYLKDTLYIINHDHFGNSLNTEFNILSSENKIKIFFHPILKKNVLFYFNKINKVYVYYDNITLQYLGYSYDNKTIKTTKNNATLKIELSLKDNILLLGYDNQYSNIFYINKKYFTKLPEKNEYNEIILKIIRNRIINLKQIILRSQSIINNIKNSGIITSIYNIQEKEIITEFVQKIKNINTNKNKNIFKHNQYILNNMFIDYNINTENFILNDNHFDVLDINSLKNLDIMYIYYLIYNFIKILDYNNNKIIENEIALLIIKIIKFSFNLYYKPYSNYNIRKFDFLLLNETPFIDETLKIVGHYQELLSQKEIDDVDIKNDEYDAQEAFESLDIDDYDIDEDIDGRAEALDGYED